MKHLVVTPYRNEEQFIENTIQSVLDQEVLPNLWILINDYSTDKSFSIVEVYKKKFSWIRNYNATINEAGRQEGGKIIQLVNDGLKNVNLSDFDIFTKLDADIILQNDYFKIINEQFKINKNLGLCGGKIFSKVDKKFIDEKKASYHVRGANKSYRVKALLNTDCFKPVMGWDGLDEMILMYYEYEVKLLDVQVYQQRLTRERFSEIDFYYKNAYGKYKLGHSFLLAIIRSIKRSLKKPYLLGGISYFVGHCMAFIKREEIIIDRNIAKYINQFHYKRIFRNKFK